MKVPVSLVDSFGTEFESVLSQFAVSQKLIENTEQLFNERFISRSIVPHVQKLSRLFNRLTEDDPETLKAKKQEIDAYWKDSSNPENLRLAYFLYFMPSNMFRVASVWAELHRLGFRFPEHSTFKAIEWGAGPASGAAGIAMAESITSLGCANSGDFALIERDRATLQLGENWAKTLFDFKNRAWGTRPFHRTIDWLDHKTPLLPRSAPQFNLWLSSFFINESGLETKELAQKLLKNWDRHLADEGLAILVEPALKLQSRKLLELRRELLSQIKKYEYPLRVLLPCLGHQTCGALEAPEDWCHEEVTWMRPSYFKKIDAMAKLDRKTLPFSYLVIAKSNRTRDELLPALAKKKSLERLVSPAHYEGQDQEFYMCGEEGKRRARFKTKNELERGDILNGVVAQGDARAVRIDKGSVT